MKKRGQLVYKALIVIIASAIVVFAFVKAGASYGSQEAFYKLAAAKDIALTIDLMYALSGDIEYVYPNDISAYGIEVKDNNVRVYNYKLGKNDPTTVAYTYAGISNDVIRADINGQKFVKLSKINNQIKIMGVNQ